MNPSVTNAANCPLCRDAVPGRHPDSGGTHAPQVDITSRILAVHPSAVVTRRHFDGGTQYEIKVPGRVILPPARLSVEYGDDEAAALRWLLDKIG